MQFSLETSKTASSKMFIQLNQQLSKTFSIKTEQRHLQKCLNVLELVVLHLLYLGVTRCQITAESAVCVVGGGICSDSLTAAQNTKHQVPCSRAQ